MKSIAFEADGSPRRSDERARVPLLVLLALWLFLALCLAPPAAAQGGPDRLILRGGERIGGRVLLESEERLVYRAGGRTHALRASEIALVRSVERGLRGYLERFAAVDRSDAQAVYELGLYAEANLLPGEARNAWLRVLELAPGHQGAWIKLGGVKRDGAWTLKLRGDFLTLAELRAPAGERESPLELPTAHFLIRTDGPLESALDAAVDLERAWMAFYDLVARPLELYVSDEAPEVRMQGGREARFDPAANVLHVPLRADRARSTLAAALVDCLVQNSFRPTLGLAGGIEPWASQGLGCMLLGANCGAHFEAHARDARPLALEQLLRADASHGSGPEAARFAAQSCTLAHFLAFSEGGRRSAGFAEYLRRSYLGHGGTTALLEALGADGATLEEEWTAYVRSVAGVRPSRGRSGPAPGTRAAPAPL